MIDTLSTLGIISGTGYQHTELPAERGLPSPVQQQPQPQPGGAGGTAGLLPIEEPQIAVLETTNSLLGQRHARTACRDRDGDRVC